VSRAQLLTDREESLPSDSQFDDSESDDGEVQATQGSELDTPEPITRQEPQPDVAQTINQTRQEDQKKGLAVSRQLVRRFFISVQSQPSHTLVIQSLWESLLDARIRFQKALTASNLVPSHAEFESLVDEPSARDAIHVLLDEALLLSQDLFQLQEVRSFYVSTHITPTESFPSICLKRMVRSPPHPANASRSTMGETMRLPSQLLHKRLQTWRARM